MPRAAAPSAEPQRRAGTPLPPGYVFVPKGNVYVTSNCRRRTQEAQCTVYTVVGAGARANPPPLGILVPRDVAREVRAAEAATRADRARAVARHDQGLERRFRGVVEREFPGAPPAEVAPVVARAMRKGSRRVGRTATLDLEARARLAVRAHIRHQHTEYDALLRRRVDKAQARRMTLGKIEEVVGAWGGQPHPPKPPGKGKERSRGKKTKGQAREPDGPPSQPIVLGPLIPIPTPNNSEQTPAAPKPRGSAVRTPKQVTRAAKRRQRKDRKRQERQGQGNAATTSTTSTRAPPATLAAPSTRVPPTASNRAAPLTRAAPQASPASGTAAAPIFIEDDESETDGDSQGYESDDYAWRETDDELGSDGAEGEDDYDSDTAENDNGYWSF